MTVRMLLKAVTEKACSEELAAIDKTKRDNNLESSEQDIAEKNNLEARKETYKPTTDAIQGQAQRKWVTRTSRRWRGVGEGDAAREPLKGKETKFLPRQRRRK